MFTHLVSWLVTSLLGIDARVAFVITVLQREKVVGIATTPAKNERLTCFRIRIIEKPIQLSRTGT